jgi:hypothetical protein
MPDIQLTPDTYSRLLKRVVSFDDQPEDVVARLLDEVDGVIGTPAPDNAPEPATRAAPGSVLPLNAYWIPILQILEDANGEAPANDVIDALETRMGAIFTERDRQPLQSGAIRWRSRARFARLRMKERGLLSSNSPRGLWAITPAGREFLEKGRGD